MKPEVSIILPHLRTPGNDAALKVALDCIVSNTTYDYELIVESVQERRDIYPVVNRMVDRAIGEWIIFSNSDVFFAPNWLDPMWAAREPDVIVSGVLVECGAIGVNVLNLHHNWGMRPETFDRAGFEAWAEAGGEWREGDRAWYFPSLHHKKTFQEMGGFDLSKGHFPDPLDIDYWDRWAKAGKTFKRVKSFAYHLQNFSNPDEENKPVRFE